MATALKKRRKIHPEQVWDHCAHKLCINIKEADDICSAKKNTYCKLYCGKFCVKTGTAKKTSNPKWNELFYLEPKETDIIRIEIYYTKRLSDQLIGECILGTVGPMKRETVVTNWVDVNSKKKGSIGKIHLSFYYSTMLESRELEQRYCHKFCYKQFESQMKSGDLIAYSSTGVIAAGIKLSTDCEYSHLGLVLKIPNKWTQERELFVMEIGRNNDGFLDAFYEEPRQGICIHRLIERLHHFHGKGIAWIPLGNELNESARNDLEDYAVSVHMADDPFDYTLGGQITDFLMNFFSIGKNKFSICDLYGPYIIGSALIKAGITIRKDPKLLTVHDIIQLPHFKKPMIIRKQDRTATKTIKHTKPIYPTKKTIKRRDPNDTDSSFSLQEFSNSNMTQTPLSSIPRKSPFRKSSSLEMGKHSPSINVLSPRSQLLATLDTTSQPVFSQIPMNGPSAHEISQRTRAVTTVPLSGDPPQIFMTPQSVSVFQQPIVQGPIETGATHTPINLTKSLNSSTESTSTLNRSLDSDLSHSFGWNDYEIPIDNSNDATIKLPR